MKIRPVPVTSLLRFQLAERVLGVPILFIFFAISSGVTQSPVMTEPLALVFYERLLPGQQLINRLHDLGYRTQAVTDASLLEIEAQTAAPMLLIAEFPANKSAVSDALSALKKNPRTTHVPVLAYTIQTTSAVQEKARAAGAKLIASEKGLLDQLPHLLEQLLQVD